MCGYSACIYEIESRTINDVYSTGGGEREEEQLIILI